MISRPIWFTPSVKDQFEADAYFVGFGWVIRYVVDGRRRWTWVFRLYWSNHFDRL